MCIWVNSEVQSFSEHAAVYEIRQSLVSSVMWRTIDCNSLSGFYIILMWCALTGWPWIFSSVAPLHGSLFWVGSTNWGSFTWIVVWATPECLCAQERLSTASNGTMETKSSDNDCLVPCIVFGCENTRDWENTNFKSSWMFW